MRWLYPIILICILYHVFVENSIRGLCVYSSFSNPFFFVYCGAKFVLRKALTFGADRVTIQTTKTPRVRQMPYSGSIFLTTVYPTDTLGVHGNSGGKSAGKDVFPSGKGRKCLKSSGNRYFGFLWDHQAAGSSPVTPTKHE